MTPDQARRYVEVLALYEGDLETLVKETRADKPGLTSALNPHLHDMARGVATVREKITADAENMTRMIASMREEWRAEFQGAEGGWHIVPDHRGREWGDKEWAGAVAAQWHNDGFRVRLVRRYVTEPGKIT